MNEITVIKVLFTPRKKYIRYTYRQFAAPLVAKCVTYLENYCIYESKLTNSVSSI